MRTSNGINYPDAVGFAMLPVMFVATGTGITAIEITMSNEGGDTVVVNQSAYGGGCYVDMRDYVAGLFGDVTMPDSYTMALSSAFAKLTYTVRKKSGGSWSTAINQGITYFIWGAPHVLETWGCNRYPTIFGGMPFFVDLWNQGGQTFNFTDGSQTIAVQPQSIGLWHVPVPSQFDNADVVFVDDSIGRVTIKRETCANGILLRFIDRHGMIVHWVFTRGVEGRETANSGQYRRNNLLNWSEDYGWRGMNGDGYWRSRKDTTAIAALSVTSGEYDMIIDAVTSPIVEMYVNGAWARVRIEPNNYTKRKDTLQDLELTMIIEDIPIQGI